jgi:hypothetical protein
MSSPEANPPRPCKPSRTHQLRHFAAAGLAIIAASCASGNSAVNSAAGQSSTGTVSTSLTKKTHAITVSTTQFTFDGFSVRIPDNWHTGKSENDDGSAYLTAASSPVNSDEAGLGIGSQPNMAGDDVLVNITEIKNPPDKSGFPSLTGVPQVGRAQLGDFAVPAPAMSIENYTESGRYFEVGVAFGSLDPTDAQFSEANQVLSSLAVQPDGHNLGQ